MPRSGTLVVCVQNLDYSGMRCIVSLKLLQILILILFFMAGANQVILNIILGRMHESNVVVISPVIGSFAARFVDSGAAVRIGNITNLLMEIRDIFCIVCNTIMTADIVVDLWKRSLPVVWIIHEWWTDEMITENLKIRNLRTLDLAVVKDALKLASMIVFVCEAQRNLYKPTV